MLTCYQSSFQVIVDHIVELLDTPGEVDHDQIKVCHFSFSFLFLPQFTYTSSRAVCIFFSEMIRFSCPLNIRGQ
jgi:hypothetical protein